MANKNKDDPEWQKLKKEMDDLFAKIQVWMNLKFKNSRLPALPITHKKVHNLQV